MFLEQEQYNGSLAVIFMIYLFIVIRLIYVMEILERKFQGKLFYGLDFVLVNQVNVNILERMQYGILAVCRYVGYVGFIDFSVFILERVVMGGGMFQYFQGLFLQMFII